VSEAAEKRTKADRLVGLFLLVSAGAQAVVRELGIAPKDQHSKRDCVRSNPFRFRPCKRARWLGSYSGAASPGYRLVSPQRNIRFAMRQERHSNSRGVPDVIGFSCCVLGHRGRVLGNC